MPLPSSYRVNPGRLYLYPLLLGLLLMGFCILVWMFPRILLLLILLPLFLVGLGLVLFGLDLWRGIPNWRDRISQVKVHWWPGEDEER